MTVSNAPALIGIIAGKGDLPREIIAECQQKGRPFLVVAYEGQTELETYQPYPHILCRLGKMKETLEKLRESHVHELVFAGSFRRPSWAELRPDALCAKWLAQSAKNIFGDDSLLRVLIKNLEQEGFIVKGAEDIIGEKILAPTGVWGRYHPDETAQKDIVYGLKLLTALGVWDIGQAIVIQQGLVLGIEAIEGTNALLERCGTLRREGPKGILVKSVKPAQETRIDRPVVGPQTLFYVFEAGLGGIAVEAGGVIVHHLSEMIHFANEKGLFLMGIKP